jgi:hypothetical protein
MAADPSRFHYTFIGRSKIFYWFPMGYILTTIEDMPRISEFYGIVIEMYWSDHNRPTFMLGMESIGQRSIFGASAS